MVGNNMNHHHSNNHTPTSGNDNTGSPTTEMLLPPNPRNRLPSQDLHRTYSGHIADEVDKRPVEVNRVESTGIFTGVNAAYFFLGNYIALVVFVQFVVQQVFMLAHQAWTITHAIHCLASLMHFHWLKGNMADPQGEMSAMTLWEQLVALGPETERVQQGLRIIPVLICYAACQCADYQPLWCFWNIVLLGIELFAKSPLMVGVRIWGINRTPGIDDEDDDDDDQEEDEDDDIRNDDDDDNTNKISSAVTDAPPPALSLSSNNNTALKQKTQ